MPSERWVQKKLMIMETVQITKDTAKKQETSKKIQTEERTSLTGSQAVLEAFIAEGVDTIFGYPGGAIMPIYDALYDYNDKLQHILVRHEQGAIHAAQGYAYLRCFIRLSR
jgi:acetolactate synthase-1/2/3 large subunit